MLSSEIENEIINRWKHDCWPLGTIARHLRVHRDTVRRVLRKHEMLHDGVAISERKLRKSIIDNFIPFIEETLQKYPNICASRIFQMIKERGYQGVSPGNVRLFVSKVRPSKAKEAFFRLRMLPAEQAQVDWADFGVMNIGKAKRRLCAFVMVLSYSRAIYVRFFYGMRMREFLHGHVSSFEYFGASLDRFCTTI